MERRRLEGDRLPAQEVPLFAPSGTVALRKQRVDGAEQLVEAQAIRVAPPPLGPVSLGQDVVGVVLQIAGRAHGGNYFHRAGMSAQLLIHMSGIFPKPEQLQVGDVFDDDRRRDVRDVIVGADFRVLHRGTESVGRRKGPAHRLCGL